jgi:protocatechuate 3,4-dioxygenase beta subunit
MKRVPLKSIVIFVLIFGEVAGQTCPFDATPRDVLGPFYVSGAPLTNWLAPEKQLSNPQNRLLMTGTVFGQDCIPMADALIERWYAGLPDGNGNMYSVAGSALQYRCKSRQMNVANTNSRVLFPSLTQVGQFATFTIGSPMYKSCW